VNTLSKRRTSAEDITRYFSQLGSLFKETQVTDAKGAPLELSQGIREAIDLIQGQSARGKKIIFIGNGGSSSIASHQATDFLKNGGIKAIAFTDPSLLTCVSNDLGYPRVFEVPIKMLAEGEDVLVAISSSGRSENILRGVEAARGKGCEVITMSGFTADNPLRKTGRLNFYVPSGSYGYVEISHLTLCHCILDMMMGLV
jgi:D-sedoheptulose 7-phosphate isomerase